MECALLLNRDLRSPWYQVTASRIYSAVAAAIEDAVYSVLPHAPADTRTRCVARVSLSLLKEKIQEKP